MTGRSDNTRLARPVWDALSTRQAEHAAPGDGTRARRFALDIGPLAGACDEEPASLAALAALVPADGGTLLLLQEPAIAVPPGTLAVTTAPAVQMVAERALPRVDDERIVRLGDADAPEMLELATLTRPGPFGARTHQLGAFWGIRDRGRLVAMAGERMAHRGFTEVSGVCTHPDARGRGLARILSSWVAAQIAARGDTPYLHAYASNTAAIELYRSLGFAVCRAMHVAALARA